MTFLTVSTRLSVYLPTIAYYTERSERKRTTSHSLQAYLKHLEEWADKWGMRFNTKKCYVLSINNKSSRYYQLEKHFEDYITSNIVEKHTCNNTKGLELPDYKKQQYQHSFFVDTVIHWNHLPNSVVHTNSLDRSKKSAPIKTAIGAPSTYPFYKNHSWVLQRTRYRYKMTSH
jgi:hypothetical protein